MERFGEPSECSTYAGPIPPRCGVQHRETLVEPGVDRVLDDVEVREEPSRGGVRRHERGACIADGRRGAARRARTSSYGTISAG